MKTLTRRLLLLVPATLLLLFAGVYFFLGAWLESAGGRRAVERALSERLGMPVTLQGEFDIMLLPSIGVSGTDLVLGPPGPASEFARSREYAVALAVRPLLDRRLLIQSIELGDGRLYPARLSPGGATAPTGPASLRLPEIRGLAVREFEIVTADGGGRTVFVQAFELQDFAVGRAAPFRLAVAGYGVFDGQLLWDAQRPALLLDSAWTGLLSGQLRLRVDAALAAGSGMAQAAWIPGAAQGEGGEIRLELDYATVRGGLFFSGIRLDAGGQSAAGTGCLRLQGAPSLNLWLESSRLDYDALPALPSLIGGGGEESAGVSAQLNLRLAADEARAGGAVARDAVFLVGEEPDCAGLDPATLQ
jgi:hypothetical protein